MARNYGDVRIIEFERLAIDWTNSSVDPNHPNNHLIHAERYRQKAQKFREHHEADSYWRDKAELNLEELSLLLD